MFAFLFLLTMTLTYALFLIILEYERPHWCATLTNVLSQLMEVFLFCKANSRLDIHFLVAHSRSIQQVCPLKIFPPQKKESVHRSMQYVIYSTQDGWRWIKDAPSAHIPNGLFRSTSYPLRSISCPLLFRCGKSSSCCLWSSENSIRWRNSSTVGTSPLWRSDPNGYTETYFNCNCDNTLYADGFFMFNSRKATPFSPLRIQCLKAIDLCNKEIWAMRYLPTKRLCRRTQVMLRYVTKFHRVAGPPELVPMWTFLWVTRFSFPRRKLRLDCSLWMGAVQQPKKHIWFNK